MTFWEKKETGCKLKNENSRSKPFRNTRIIKKNKTL